MVARQPADVSPDHIAALIPLIRQILRARVGNAEQVDDLVQTCLSRLLERRATLSPDTLAGYAVVVARNAATTRARELDRHRRHLPRLLDLRSPPDPADEATRADDAAALHQAVGRLAPQDREILVAHDLDQVDTATLAGRTASTPAGVASRLNRTRGRLRVEYLLAIQRTVLPTSRCHPVLVALSTADRRRQHTLDAGRHLTNCPTCASLSAPLIERRRGALLLLPLLVVTDRLRPAGRWVRRHPLHSAATATTITVVAVAVTALTAQPSPLHSPPSARPKVPIDIVGGGPVAPRRATGQLAPPEALGTVLFAENGVALDASAQAVIASAVQAIRQHHDTAVTVTGYTDTNGTASINQKLSLQRAQAVVTALRRRLHGLNVQVHTESAGQAHPMASNHNSHGRQLNRRVLIQARK